MSQALLIDSDILIDHLRKEQSTLDYIHHETEEQIRRLAYVAVTRARERLFIPYCSGNELIGRLLKYT